MSQNKIIRMGFISVMHKTINMTSENVFQVLVNLSCGPTGYARNGGTNDSLLMDDVLYLLTS